jgi:hypothetical protein
VNTRSIISSLLAAGATLVNARAAAPAADNHNFSRYQIILDRSPFSPPAGSVEVQQPNFAARYGFIGTVKPDETSPLLAVIQDKEAANRIYFKEEGETIGGATIVSIGSSPGAKLVLKQGLETATLTLEAKAGVGAAAAPPPSAPAAPGAPQPVPLGQPPVRRIPFRRGD